MPPAGIEPAQYRYRGILSVLHWLRNVQIGNNSLHNRRIYRCGLCNIEQFKKGRFGARKHQTNTTIYDAYMTVAACAFCRILVYSDQGTVIRRQAVGHSHEKGGDSDCGKAISALCMRGVHALHTDHIREMTAAPSTSQRSFD